MHQRRRIRDAAVAALTGLATTASNVFGSRVYPVVPAELPCLLVYTTEEQSTVESMGHPRLLMRECIMQVEAICTVTADLENTMDQIAAEIEHAMGGDLTLRGTAKDVSLVQTSKALRGEGAEQFGGMSLLYRVVYATPEDDPTLLR